jgi:hypothetical protein
VQAAAAVERAGAVYPEILELRTAGCRTWTAIARELNRRGRCTWKGGSWYRSAVKKAAARVEGRP